MQFAMLRSMLAAASAAAAPAAVSDVPVNEIESEVGYKSY